MEAVNLYLCTFHVRFSNTDTTTSMIPSLTLSLSLSFQTNHSCSNRPSIHLGLGSYPSTLASKRSSTCREASSLANQVCSVQVICVCYSEVTILSRTSRSLVSSTLQESLFTFTSFPVAFYCDRSDMPHS